MKHRKFSILFYLLFISNIILISAFLSPSSRAAVYELEIKENDSFIWEVTELNLHNFKKTFGLEPNFELGDHNKIVVKKILQLSSSWTLTLEEWYFTNSFGPNGTITYATVHLNPADYEDDIFILSPAGEYLLEAYKTLPSEYIVSGLTVTYRGTWEETGKDYRMIKKYNSNGIMITESYLDENGIVCATIEATFQSVPSSIIEPILFMALSTFGLVLFVLKTRKIEFQ